jgi:predicted O-linked N-acetylglucosamine transferase (SPINDLY family)
MSSAETGARVGRNEPCPCGSGRKYKHCHGNQAASPAPAASAGTAGMEAALGHHRAGRLNEAETLYRKLLTQQPEHVDANHMLGLLLHQRGEHAAALAPIGKALTLRSRDARIHNNLAEVLRALGRLDEAIGHYQTATALDAGYVDAFNNLGVALNQAGRLAEAERALQRAIALDARSLNAHSNLGNLYQDIDRADDAIAAYGRALALDANDAEVHNNLGNAWKMKGRLDEAVSCYQRALQLQPNYAVAANNLGTVLHRRGELDASLAAYQRASSISPNLHDIASNRSLLLLARGDLESGWREYQRRFTSSIQATSRRPHSHREWQGEPLLGKVLLIYPEQGVGDELWLAGMFGEMLERVGPDGRVVIECAAKLRALFQRSFAGAMVVAKRDPPALECIDGVDGRNIDYQVAAGSLGQFLRPDLASFPKREATGGAYLIADAGREAHWKQKLAQLGPGLKVGVCWRSSNVKGDRALYCTLLTQWGDVLKVPGVQFVNLQYDECEAELQESEAAFGVKIQRYPEVDMFNDLDETAALMRGLDLVISAGTAVSILSAALGVPTWQLNYGLDWQCHGLPHNPWYAAMRNYPRQWNESWEKTLQRISHALAHESGAAPSDVLYAQTTGPSDTDACGDIGNRLIRAIRLGDPTDAVDVSGCKAEPQMAELAAVARRRANASTPIPSTIEEKLVLDAALASESLAEFHLRLASGFRLNGRLEAARACAEAGIRRLPRSPDAYEELAAISFASGDRAGACRSIEAALQFEPANGRRRDLLAELLADDATQQKDPAVAISLLNRAIALRPPGAQTHCRLGWVLHHFEQYDSAIDEYRSATRVQPQFPVAWNNLGTTLRAVGEAKESVDAFRRAVEFAPDFLAARSNLLLAMNYAEGITAREFVDGHLEFGKVVSNTPTSAIARGNTIDSRRKLRIGYVSGDFLNHSVAIFFEPILQHHDHERFEIYCYSNNERTDATTERLRQHRVNWRTIAGLDDEAALKMIRNDNIDILVDLSGHTAHNRLPVFARRAAPVQASYLGYAATTGVPTMDYKILDRWTLANDPLPAWKFTEEILPLPRTMWAYGPDPKAPEVAAAPAQRNGYVTFGSFNAILKLGPALIACWCNILRQSPRSKLLIATVPEGRGRGRVLQEVLKAGIDPARIEFSPRLDKNSFLELHARVDLAFDSFPCNGGTTTLDTLWQGVPIVALGAEDAASPVSSVSAGILRSIGLEILVARDTAGYEALAISLANDTGQIASLRREMRDRLRKSPLLDHLSFVRDLESAYRKMWLNWCAEKGASG